MAKRVTDSFDEVSIASFSADITEVDGDDVTLRVKSVHAFEKGTSVTLQNEFVIVSREKDFMKQHPQGGLGWHVEGVVTTDFASKTYNLRHIVCPV